MNEHLKQIAAVALLLSWLCCFGNIVNAGSSDRTKPPYASDKSLSEPTVFAPGIISTGDYDSHPAFTPDGRTLYFVRSNPNFSFWTILVSHFQKGKWSEPEVAPFSGQYSDADPFIAPDARYSF